ncbi:MAG: hypothetical protein M1840_006135 [Geoglossum simile]|nr:MAG: hypothetical protein M1840_006135 [Geoglossum simile]
MHNAITIRINRLLRRRGQQQQQQRQPTIPPGDLPQALAPGRKVKPKEIRDLRDLIRKRYELDVEIWDLRFVRPCDRHIVEDKMRRSDAALQKIRRIIRAWDSRDAFESLDDWEKLQEIKLRIESGGKRIWADGPPWNYP